MDGSLLMNDTNDDMVWKTLTKSEEDIVFVLGSLANKRRLQLLTSLLKSARNFKELLKVTSLGKTALAHHLGLLVKTGVVKHVGRGRYELSPDGAELLTAVSSAYANSRRRKERDATMRADYIRRTHEKRKEKRVKELEVSIVTLEPMRVASFHAISKSPERLAAEKLIAWAKPRGLLEDPERYPVYGFNNPDPSPEQKEYGYEFWIRMDPDFESDDVEVKDFKGGLYAVTICANMLNPHKDIPSTWKRLVEWIKSSKYDFAKHQWLEKAPEIENPDSCLFIFVSNGFG